MNNVSRETYMFNVTFLNYAFTKCRRIPQKATKNVSRETFTFDLGREI